MKVKNAVKIPSHIKYRTRPKLDKEIARKIWAWVWLFLEICSRGT